MGGPKPKPVKPPPLPPMPTVSDPAVIQATQNQRKATQNAGTAAKTILTGPSGVQNEDVMRRVLTGSITDPSNKKTLLGG